MMHKSLATIESPEFINLQPLEINPLMSSCEIKVLYLGENRNHSYITKEVATDMAKTLRGAPIVGYFKEDVNDFRDHGDRVIMDDEGIKFECMTKPYGFVAPDAKVWFQKFEDTDEFGNVETREYLMTTGYLWTGQYEEAKLAVEEGRPQSMELDVETLDGHWSTNHKTGMDFFIINDAIFSKLCILGEDVEPCFEGASVTAPEVSTTFSKMDDNFKNTLYTMMQDLKFALEGGKNMDMEQNVVTEEVVEETAIESNEEVVESVETEAPATEFDSLARDEEPVVEETPVVEEEITEEVVEEETNTEEETEVEAEEISEETVVEEVIEEISEETVVEEEILEENDNSEQSISAENEEYVEATLSSQENFAKSDDEEKEEDKDTDEESNDEETDTDDDKEDEDEEDKKYSLLEENYNKLQAEFAELSSKYEALVEFKNTVDNEKKDALIASFYMLSEEDKAEIIENKANYSLDDIEAKLSVICVRKKVNFDLDDTSKNDNTVEEENVMTYSLSSNDMASTPAWITALKNTRDNRK
jgi:hypothetical protein